ncbi:MAG: ABC transporter permease [Saprospiraceae bacterium]|nr:ABC transporter permease [Saprospiraceae bacterium]
MFKNYLTITLRNLLKNRINSTINILGLALGLTGAMVIALWIQRELSMDQFHTKADRLYRVMEHQTYSNDFVLTVFATPGPLVPALKEEIPEIEKATRITWGNQLLFTVGDKAFKENGHYADEDFFQMFSFKMLHGDANTALKQPTSIAISEDLANKYFNTSNAIGKVIRIDNIENYQVSAVFAKVPDQSTLQFDFVMPVESFVQKNDWLKTWNSNGIQAFIQLSEGADANALEAKLKNFLIDHSDQKNAVLDLISMGDTYLHMDYKDGKYQGGGRIVYVKLFAIIALFLILIACINFMNLSTARSALRAKEVGIRRVTGAVRGQLFGQFLGESLIMSFISGLIAIGLTALILPWFNNLFETEIVLKINNPNFWLAWLSIVILTGLVSGSYPALFLSSFQPIEVFKGVVKTGKGAVWFRQGLVVAQFAIAIFLVVGTLVIYNQMNYIRNKNLGYNKDNLLYIPSNETLSANYEIVKSELKQIPGIQEITTSDGLIYSWGSNTSNFSWEGKNPDQDILFNHIGTSYDFVKTIGAELKAGRDFSKEFATDSVNFIINEESARLMGMTDPVGKSLTWGDTKGQIIGLVKDFSINSLHTAQQPVILYLQPFINVLYVRIDGQNVSNTLAQMEKVVKKHSPAYPFEYRFLDEEYDQLYRSEQRVSSLSRAFAILAIFVSCLGLFGLAAFTAEQRTKEIGIRKVLGASVTSLVTLLSTDFLKLVLISTLIAFPLGWWAMNQWLERFAYRIELSWWLFVIAGVLAVVIAMLTVSSQAIRAAVANPADSLKSE